MRRTVTGSVVAVLAVAVLSAIMLPLRGHLSVATTALVLVVPVVAGVAAGGFAAGVVAVACGFLVYDFVFIPPYFTLSVGASQNWVALGVYAAVMLLVAQVTARLDAARTRAQVREDEARRLFELSELLVADRTVSELLETIVRTVLQAFGLEGVTLLLPVDGRLTVASSAGSPPSAAELARVAPEAGFPGGGRPGDGRPGGAAPASGAEAIPPGGLVSLGTSAVTPSADVVALALSASGRPVGLLVLRGLVAANPDRSLLRTFANHLALALERAQLHEQAIRAEGLEEVDRLRRSLMSAVSHDLRTPLATIKVAASSLEQHDDSMSRQDARELIGLIDAQSDRLSRLVSNLLDMSRIQAGALDVRREPTDVSELVAAAVAVLGPSLGPERVRVSASGVPLVDVDPVLVVQVLANLLENAARHAPEGGPITVTATPAGEARVLVAVTDTGPGVPEGERESIFLMFNRREAGGRAGLGLAIAAAFVEVHDERIWVEAAPGGGARFVFTLPVAAAAPAVTIPAAADPLRPVRLDQAVPVDQPVPLDRPG